MNKKYISNAQKPIGEMGRKRIQEMNLHHTPLIDWGFSFLNGLTSPRCLDLGCGGGETTRRLLLRKGTEFVTGIDYSKVAVEEASKRNQEDIKKGRCQIIRGDVSSLSFIENSYSFALAVETIYFWPHIEETFREIARVLTPGASFMILNEDDGKNVAYQERLRPIMPNMNFYTAEALKTLLLKAGFSSVTIHEKSPWICLIGKK